MASLIGYGILAKRDRLLPAVLGKEAVNTARTLDTYFKLDAPHRAVEIYEVGAADLPVGKLSDAQIDLMLSAAVPGGSQARDWFLPHEHLKGLENVRDVVRQMVAAVRVAPAVCVCCANAGYDECRRNK